MLFKIKSMFYIFVELAVDKRYLYWRLFFIEGIYLVAAYGVHIAEKSGTKINREPPY